MGESDGHRHSLQRCIPVHGLAFDSAVAAYRDLARDEAVTGRFQRQGMETRCWLCLDDFLWLLRRVDAQWQPCTSMDLLVDLATATAEEGNDEVADKIRTAQRWTVVSWCTYPIVYLFPMFGITGSMAVVGIQIGYSVSDIISKCGVGLVIYQISAAKTKLEMGEKM